MPPPFLTSVTNYDVTIGGGERIRVRFRFTSRSGFTRESSRPHIVSRGYCGRDLASSRLAVISATSNQSTHYRLGWVPKCPLNSHKLIQHRKKATYDKKKTV